MQLKMNTLIVFLLMLYQRVDGYCVPGTDTKIDIIQPLNGKKLPIRTGGEGVIMVRFKGNPQVRWHHNGKEIPVSAKSKHFDFSSELTGQVKAGPKLKIKNFNKKIAGSYKVTINRAGCTNSQVVTVVHDASFNLQSHIDYVLKKVPYLKTKAGACLVIVGFGFVFIIIPLLICGALCSKIRKIKKELLAEKGKLEMFYAHESKRNHKHHKINKAKKAGNREKSKHNERQPMLEESSSEDLPSVRPPKRG